MSAKGASGVRSRARLSGAAPWPRLECSCCPPLGGVALNGAQFPGLRELAQRGDQRIDLGIGVGRRYLDPEADLGPRHQRECGERDVNASVKQHLTDVSDPRVVAYRHLDDRELA